MYCVLPLNPSSKPKTGCIYFDLMTQKQDTHFRCPAFLLWAKGNSDFIIRAHCDTIKVHIVDIWFIHLWRKRRTGDSINCSI